MKKLKKTLGDFLKNFSAAQIRGSSISRTGDEVTTYHRTDGIRIGSLSGSDPI